MLPDPLPALSFDDVQIDFAGRRLTRAGQAMALEPKAFDVLALLAGTPGHAFTRDQILDAVWGHRHVTPGVLNRIMTLLRHALGEEAQAPRYLRTLHGVGYRFDLPPVPDTFESAANAVANPEAPLLPADPEPRRDRRSSDVDPAPGAEAPAAIANAAAPSSRRSWRALLLVGLVLVLAALAWGWARQAPPPAAPRSKPAVHATPTLIVMPLKPIGASSSDRELAAGLSDELITELAHIHGLRVIARESTSLAAAQSSDISGLVPRLNISHALEGSLRQAGEQLRVHLRLTEASSGRTLWAQDYDRKAADVLVMQRDIARAVAATLALQLGLQSRPAAQGGDAEFLRRYFAANALLQREVGLSLDSIDRAETEFRALVRLRPEDGRAHAGLAQALSTRAFSRPALAEDLRAEALQEAALALRLDPNLADPYRVQAAAACRANDWQRCLDQFERARALEPSASQPPFRFAMALASLGYLDRAAAMLREGIARDPLNPTLHFGYARILDTQGKHELAQRQLALSQGQSVYARWFNAAWRHDLAAAAEISRSMGQDDAATDASRMLQPSHVAVTKALADPSAWPQADAAMQATERQSGMMNFLRVLQPGQAPGRLIAGLDEARERSYSTWDLLLWTRDLAYLRRDPAFQAYLRDNGILAYWRRHGFPVQCRPRGDGADCD
jgi:TolB-like protein/DNA-binding winged helix-turn-helix (wHTH) protein